MNDEHELARAWKAILKPISQRREGIRPIESAGLAAIGDRMAEALNEYERLFKLQWDADQRAIKMWHEAGGDELTWPDSAKLTVWLLEQLDDANGEIEALKQDMESLMESLNGEVNENERLRKELVTLRDKLDCMPFDIDEL